MFTTKLTLTELSIPELLDTYQDVEKFIEYCQSCNNFGQRWSCPPVTFDPKAYLKKFDRIAFIGIQIIYDKSFLASLTEVAEAQKLAKRIIRRIKREVSGQLLECEQQFSPSLSLSSGACEWCCKCTREKPEQEPCRKPTQMRYSLDAFGLDLTRLSKECLNTEILWAGEYLLPDYHTLIHGFATNAADVASVRHLLETSIKVTPFTLEELLSVRHTPAMLQK